MTVDEFLALGEAPFKYWLVEGRLVVNEPKLPHQIAVGNILYALDDVVDPLAGDDVLTSPLLPGFGAAVAGLFVP